MYGEKRLQYINKLTSKIEIFYLKSLSSDNAAEIDGIPAKPSEVVLNQNNCLLQTLSHEAWDNDSFPIEWIDGDFIKIRFED